MKYEGSKFDKDPKGTKEGSKEDEARDKKGRAEMERHKGSNQHREVTKIKPHHGPSERKG